MSILEEIKAYKLEDVAARKQARPLEAIEQEARAAGPVRQFEEQLRQKALGGAYGLIAEIKKASPSKGLIRADFDPAGLAAAYAEGGATCLSVLTDTPSFQGADTFLKLAREACALPVLRKDFLFDPWQVIESRALGADCILVIMSAVSDDQARELEATATEWGMSTLIEIHDETELERAKALKSGLFGINNRNLNTFETDVGTTRRLARGVPENRTIVSESGLSSRQDLAQLARFGVRCFLIGEALMRADDVAAATRDLLRSPWSPQAE